MAFAYIENNPIVRLEAVLGLSPAPLERFFGIKSLFSGMTESVHQFVRLNFVSSFRSNPFGPLVIPVFVVCCLFWWVPTLDTKKKEIIFFLLFITASAVVNLLS